MVAQSQALLVELGSCSMGFEGTGKDAIYTHILDLLTVILQLLHTRQMEILTHNLTAFPVVLSVACHVLPCDESRE